MSETCTRPSWSDADNDPCPCDNHEAFEVMYGTDCSCCTYWKEQCD